MAKKKSSAKKKTSKTEILEQEQVAEPTEPKETDSGIVEESADTRVSITGDTEPAVAEDTASEQESGSVPVETEVDTGEAETQQDADAQETTQKDDTPVAEYNEEVADVSDSTSSDTTAEPELLDEENSATARFAKMQLELVRMFHLLNEEYFDNFIKTPVINIQTGRSGPKQTSWSSRTPVWVEKDGVRSLFYEISLGGEFLDRPAEDIILSLYREMIHIYNAQQGIQDTSRGGTWHNKKFKEAAEAHGLTVEPEEKYGYSKVAFTPELLHFVQARLTQGVFDIFWTNPEEKVVEKPKRAKKVKTPEEEVADMELKAIKVEVQNFLTENPGEEADIASIAARYYAAKLDAEGRANLTDSAMEHQKEREDAWAEEHHPVDGDETVQDGGEEGVADPWDIDGTDVADDDFHKPQQEAEAPVMPQKVHWRKTSLPESQKKKISTADIQSALPFLYYCENCDIVLRTTIQMPIACPKCACVMDVVDETDAE